MDNYPISSRSLEKHYHIDGDQFGQQYKDHLSDYYRWEQMGHAQEWILFPENLGEYLSIDETALSNGELYTIITNKKAKGRKGALIAMIHGTCFRQSYFSTTKNTRVQKEASQRSNA